MLIPIRVPGHFILVVVYHAQQVIACYDPLGGDAARRRKSWLTSIMAWMNERRARIGLGLLPPYKFEYNAETFPWGPPRNAQPGLLLPLSSKTQEDGTSCSGYVCAAARSAICLGQPLTQAELSGNPVRELRLFMLETYLSAIGLPAATVDSLMPPQGRAAASVV